MISADPGRHHVGNLFGRLRRKRFLFFSASAPSACSHPHHRCFGRQPRRGGVEEHQVTVVLAGMKMLVNFGPFYTEPYNRLYAEIADQEQIVFMPFFLEGIAGKPELNLADGIHPNAKGYQIIATSVYPHVLKDIYQRPGQ